MVTNDKALEKVRGVYGHSDMCMLLRYITIKQIIVDSVSGCTLRIWITITGGVRDDHSM